MDETQLRFLTTQALYGRDLQERVLAIRQLTQEDLTEENTQAIHIRLEVALSCADEYVRSAAAMLVGGLAKQLPVSSDIAAELLSLSQSKESFAREAALRAIKQIYEQGGCLAAADKQALGRRLEDARHTEGEEFVLSLFEEE